jgi:hypothetical protein
MPGNPGDRPRRVTFKDLYEASRRLDPRYFEIVVPPGELLEVRKDVDLDESVPVAPPKIPMKRKPPVELGMKLYRTLTIRAHTYEAIHFLALLLNQKVCDMVDELTVHYLETYKDEIARFLGFSKKWPVK